MSMSTRFFKKIAIVIGLLLSLMSIAYFTLQQHGNQRWQAISEQLHAQLEATCSPDHPHFEFDPAQLTGLPAPVQRYLRKVLPKGARLVTAANLQHDGQFNLAATSGKANWVNFTSTERVITHHPGFDWYGKIDYLPGIDMRVHDAYIYGEGLLKASLMGRFTVADRHDREQLAVAELQRFLAEAPWYPTRLLPNSDLQWQAVDDHNAIVTINDGMQQASLKITFDNNDLISQVHAQTRYRLVENTMIASPWRGRFWQYARHDGMLIPEAGEVGWLLPEGYLPYWRGTLHQADYEFAP